MALASGIVLTVFAGALAPAVHYSGDALGCSADRYAAVFAPWTDQRQSAQLWIVPDTGDPWVVGVVDPAVERLVCTPQTVLLRSKTGVAHVGVDTEASEVAFEAGRRWSPARRDERRTFKVKKPRIVSFGHVRPRELVVARAEDPRGEEAHDVTVVLLAERPQSVELPRILFTRSEWTITVR